ncbi:MAG TPA: prepilin-type N-terminal cleavage/methylation domain-containing protein [Usitatibacter sp.]|nr:prepilin-type N-terminal cleavage/methylation domain-containing protein [Usitatibacter sp.]
MKSQQSGFTLVEIAIVLVIIGLLLGGILKGQELINSAKVKNLANDFRVIPTYIYGYQDKFKSLPGDDPNVAAHVTGSTAATTPASGARGNGVIEGAWNTTTNTDEAFLFWQHVRLANLAAGPTTVTDPTYRPQNAVGGNVGLTSATSTQTVGGLAGTYLVCSSAILGKFAKQLDVQMDDGNTATGSMRVIADNTTNASPIPNSGATCTSSPTPATCVDDATNYTVCMAF